MWGEPGCRPPWRTHTPYRDADEMDDEAQEGQARREGPPYPAASPPPGPSRVAPVSRPSGAAAVTVREDGGYAHRSPLRPPPAFPHGGPRVRRARAAALSSSATSATDSATDTSASSSPAMERPSVPVSRWRAAGPVLPTTTIAAAAAAQHRPSPRYTGATHAAHGGVDSAVVEHYHILELEEQLRYWRQRALVVEGRALRRERALQARWAAEFAAAQAASEKLTRRLLDKQRRLQAQQQQHRSRTSSTAGSESDAVSNAQPAPRARRSYTEAVEELAGMRQRVQQLTSENASLLESLAQLQQQRGQSTRSSGSTPPLDASPVAMGATLEDACRTALACVGHTRELRECHAALQSLARSTSAPHADTKDESADDFGVEGQQTTREERAVCDRLESVLTPHADAQAGVEAAGTTAAATLAALHDALAYLDASLLTCVDDAVLMHNRLATSMQPAREARHALHHEPSSLLDAHTSASTVAELQVRLRDAEARLARDAQLNHAAAREFASAELAQLRRHHEETCARLQEEARTAAAEVHRAHQAAVTRLRAALEGDAVEATRRASAAEHACAVLTQREAALQARVAALEEERNASVAKCAVLQSRVALLERGEGDARGRGTRPATTALEALLSQTPSPLPRAAGAALRATDGSDALPAGVPGNTHTNDVGPAPAEDARPRAANTPRSPSRSLSYSPPHSADKEAQRVVRGAALTSAAVTQTPSLAPRAAAAAAAAAPSSSSAMARPMHVMQPSMFAGAEGSDTRFVAWQPPSAIPTEATAATPLARLKAWEAKFHSILHPT